MHSSSSADAVAATCKRFALTPDQFDALRQKAAAAKDTAYCPYSKFRVGAALLGNDNSITTGANVENASYPVGTCAERVAFGKAVTEGGLRAFKAVAVATDISPPASPCGMCRQLCVCALLRRPLVVNVLLLTASSIREFCSMDMPVIMFDKDDNYVVMTLEEVRLRFCP
jgi:cytidine deaminase